MIDQEVDCGTCTCKLLFGCNNWHGASNSLSESDLIRVIIPGLQPIRIAK